MEVALGDFFTSKKGTKCFEVLILILVEVALGALKNGGSLTYNDVLILILVEVALGVYNNQTIW